MSRHRPFAIRPFRLFTMRRLALLIAGLTLPAGVLVCDRHVERVAAGRHTSILADLPPEQVALVLGCAATVGEGRPNRYFTARMDAAARLYLAGKCRHLLLSGDNGRHDDDETLAMFEALRKRGVPPEAMTRDQAGFDTLDSVLRAREVFGVDRMIIVSQRFHNERALAIAGHHGMVAHGWNARDVSRAAGFRTRLRESLARVKTVLDLHVLASRPKFLGPEIVLRGGS